MYKSSYFLLKYPTFGASKKQKPMKRILVLTLITCTTFAAKAQENTPVYHDLEPAVVTGTRTPTPLSAAPVLTRVVTAEAIERGGAVNLQQVLETELAGVEFHQAGYGESMSFQGLDARYLLFLVDGERVAGETYGNIDYGRIPLNNIERIEIVRGASSVLYGSSAMGAVVNIITKTPDRPVRLVASARYGGRYQKNDEPLDGRTLDTRLDVPNLNGDLYAGFDFGKLKSQSTASYSGTDGYLLRSREGEVRRYDELMSLRPMPPTTEQNVTLTAPIDTLGLSIGASRGVNLTQRFDYALDGRWKFRAAGAYSQRSRFGFPESQNTGEADGVYTWESFLTYNVQAGAEFRPDERNTFSVSYNADRYDRRMDSLQYAVPKQRHFVQNPRLLWSLVGGRAKNRLTVGVEHLAERLNFDLSRFGYGDRRSLSTSSLYAQEEYFGLKHFTLTAGARVDHSGRFGWNVTPTLSVKYSPDRHSGGAGPLDLRFNYSEGYRNPTLKELHMHFLIPNGASMHIVGNPDLKPEYNRYLALSAEYAGQTFQFSASVYGSWFRDKIDAVFGGTPGMNSDMVYANLDRSRYSGIELTARASLFAGLSAAANYNYVHQTEEGLQASQQYIYPSPHTATVQLEYMFPRSENRYRVNLAGRYIGAKDYKVSWQAPFTLPDQPGKMFRADYYWATHEAYVLVDLTAQARLTEGLSLQAGIDNLFDYRAPVVDFNACMSPGRNGFVKMIFTFE